MVKDPMQRKKKYESGIDPELTKRKLDRVRSLMVDQEGPYLAQIADVERKTKRICEAAGVATHLISQYLIFARQLYSKHKKFEGLTFQNEAQNIADLWLSRGLLCPVLVDIGELFGVTLTCVPEEEVCTQHYGYWYATQINALVRFYALNSYRAFGAEAVQQTASPPCTMQEMKVQVQTNTLNADATFTFRLNGADTALTLTVPAGATGIFTVQASVPIADNDLVCLLVNTALAGAGVIYFNPSFRSTIPL